MKRRKITSFTHLTQISKKLLDLARQVMTRFPNNISYKTTRVLSIGLDSVP